MITKVFAVVAYFAMVQAGYLNNLAYPTAYVSAPSISFGHGFPIAQEYSASHDVDYFAHPKYEFSYGVKDPHTGDQKSQHETRDGDVVKGYYSVAEPDGTLRTVHYTSDKHSGFNAIVEKSGHAAHPAVYGKTLQVAAVPTYYHH